MIREINFDGIVGPSHNFAGLSPGNLAASANAGAVSHPRRAALEGIAKMRATLALGLPQGILLPHRRPNRPWLASISMTAEDTEPWAIASALSASPMWAANAATVSPAADCADGRCHLTPANLQTMPHRAHEWPETLAQLRLAFAHPAFAVHAPVPPPFGDEGAANHMRLAATGDAPGVEIFVSGERGGGMPVRQHGEAGRAVARLHRLDPARTLHVVQSEAAVAAGAFHNDVVAVADGLTLLAHEHAFTEPARFYADLRRLLPEVTIIEVPAAEVPLADAVASYLFNAQLVTLPAGGQALVLPAEARDTPAVWTWLEALVAGNGPIRRLTPVDVRQSMRNGGGPACLRLRVVADPATVDPRFLVDASGLDRIAAVVERHWPEEIATADLASPALWRAVEQARAALLDALALQDLL